MSETVIKHQILGHIAITICFFIVILALLLSIEDINKILIAIISCFTAWFFANVWIHMKS